MNYERFHHPSKNIYLVDMTKEPTYYFSEIMVKTIKKNLQDNKRVLIISDKKGYHSGIVCQDCGHIPQCDHCSVSISYHQQGSTTMGLCHICKTQYTPPTICPNCQSTKLFAYGMGMQQLADRCIATFNSTPLQLTASKLNSFPKIQKIKPDLLRHQLFLSTSLLSQPIKGLVMDIIIFLQADAGLQIPSFDVSAKIFWKLYETFYKHHTSTFIVQSYNVDHYAIRRACAMDVDGFEQADTKFRQLNQYPPFIEMAIIRYKHPTEESVHNKIDAIRKELLFYMEKYERQDIEIYSTPPMIYKMFDKYRYHIILKGKDVRSFLDIIISKLRLLERNCKIERMPEGLE